MNKNSNIILNGPLNYIKLYNDTTKQTLWLFMDNHKNITKQKKCEEYEAKDIDKYFYKILTESTDILDFFLEINPTDINRKFNSNKNDNYILEIRKIFRKIYKEQQISKHTNIRLHYIDIRDYAFYNEIIQIMMDILDNIQQYDLSNINFIISELGYIKNILVFILETIDNIFNNKINIDDKIDIINVRTNTNTNTNTKISELLNKGFIQLLLKIFKKYSNQTENNDIVDFFKNHYYKKSEETIIFIDNLIDNLIDIAKLIDNQNNFEKLNIDKFSIGNNSKIYDYVVYYGINETTYIKLTRTTHDQLLSLNVILLKLGTVFMDCFFLRRIIDKKYINKAIIYTGGFHTVVYIWFLIKKYDFKIKDYYYINLNKLDNKEPITDLENKIKQSLTYDDFFEIFFPSTFNQCIKINNILN